MTPKKRLGRGLDALLSKPVAAAVAAKDDAGDADESLRQIPVELLQRGEYQPRVDMRQDSLEDLASSIKAQGVVQPIVVRKIAGKGVEQRYEPGDWYQLAPQQIHSARFEVHTAEIEFWFEA